MTRLVFLLFSLLPLNATEQWWAPDLDAVIAAPGNHRVLFENDAVRVLEVTVLPGTTEPMHAHRWPSILYRQSAVDTVEHHVDGTRVPNTGRSDGSVKYVNVGPPHAIENLDDVKTLRIIRVELKKER